MPSHEVFAYPPQFPGSLCSAVAAVGGHVPGHTGVLGTLPLTETTVTSDAAGGGQGSGTGTRVHGDGLADDEAIVDELADGLAGVGVGDLVDLVGVKPDLALSTANNGRRKALLRAEIDPKTLRISMRSKLCGERRE